MPPWCSPSRVTCTSLFLANQMQLCKRGRDSWGSSQRMLGPILLLSPRGHRYALAPRRHDYSFIERRNTACHICDFNAWKPALIPPPPPPQPLQELSCVDLVKYCLLPTSLLCPDGAEVQALARKLSSRCRQQD
ncbi:unnamed protein product [Gadus morhua 'NCC']